MGRKNQRWGRFAIDKLAQTRKYEVTYALTRPDGVKKLLRDRHRLGVRRYAGDTAASDILLDLNAAIDKARLSRRQAEAIAFVFGMDLTYTEAAEIMGVTRQAVGQFIDEAARKIARIYRKWDATEISYTLESEELTIV